MQRYEKLKYREKKTGLKMLSRKGVFCYEHYSHFEEIKAATSIPHINAFYSTLNEESISTFDYKFAKKMFKFFFV